MLTLTNFKMVKSNTFTEMCSLGLQIYNSPSEFIKFGSGESEIRSANLRVGDLSVYGNLYVYGTQVSTNSLGSTSDVFTIGTGIVSGNTKLIFGAYPTERSLLCDGTTITSTAQLTAPDFVKNGNSLFSTVTSEIFIATTTVSSNVPIEIPNEKVYILGSNKLLVFIDGRLAAPGATHDYIEVDNKHISFNYDLGKDAKILFLIIG